MINGNFIQWLTVYEVLNGLWKEVKLVKSISLEEAMAIVKVLEKVVRHMNILSPRGLEEEIVGIALRYDVTVYDASYIALARANNLVLVTEDRKLKERARKPVPVKSLEEL